MTVSNSYNHTIDAKNRLFIPAKYRQEIGESLHVYYDQTLPCINVYGDEEWQRISNKVLEEHDADWERFFFSNVINATCDKQGRITLNPSFCEGAGLKKDVAVVGVGKRVEIWDAEKYADEIKKLSVDPKRFKSVLSL